MEVIECYVVRVDHRETIYVSPIYEQNEYPATIVSDIPTDLDDGRGFRAIPEKGDTVLCTVSDNDRYYILGYYNIPSRAGERNSLIPESQHPGKHGWLHKLSKTAYFVGRKANQVLGFLGPWAQFDFQGNPHNQDIIEKLELKVTNFIGRFWGGYEKWERLEEENVGDSKLNTKYTGVYTRSHEPAGISDVKLEREKRNPGITDVGPPSPGRIPKNPDNLGYIDKTIVRAGAFEDKDHVWEIETRQSSGKNKTKDLFTRTRRGMQNGVLVEHDILDSAKGMSILEEYGLERDDLHFVHQYWGLTDAIEREVYLRSGDADGAIWSSRLKDLENGLSWTSRFGVDDDVLFTSELSDDNGTLVVTRDSDGLRVAVDDYYVLIKHDGTMVLESDAINLGEGAGQHIALAENLIDWIEKVLKPWLLNHSHGTGVGPSTPASGGLPPYNQFPSKVDDPADTKLDKIKNTEHKVKEK